nr:hypothetical protein [Sphingomonas sp.]
MRIELGDRARVQALIVRRQSHERRRWRCSDDLLQSPFLGFQILHARRQCARCILVLLDAGDEVGDAGAGLRQLVFGRGTLGVSGLCCDRELLLEERREALDECRGQQPLTDARQCAGFEFGRGDRAVVACSRAVPLAAPPSGAGRKERGAARAAGHQPGEEVGGALGAAQRIAGQFELRVARAAGFGLPRLHLLPQRLVDDPQLRFVADDPLRLRIEARATREATPLIGHLDPRAAVEDAATDVERVVEDAFTQRHVARQRRGVPNSGIVLAALAGARGGDAVGVEGVADPLQAPALRVQAEDPADEFGLLVVDRELVELASLRILAGDRAAVAEHATACGATARRLAAQAPPAVGSADQRDEAGAVAPVKPLCEVLPLSRDHEHDRLLEELGHNLDDLAPHLAVERRGAVDPRHRRSTVRHRPARWAGADCQFRVR